VAAQVRAVRERRRLDLALAEIKLGKRIGRPLLMLAALLAAVVVLPALWVLSYVVLDPPGTLLMASRVAEARAEGKALQIAHVPVPLSEISPSLVRAVMALEDAKFCRHDGFDVEAIQKAQDYNQNPRNQARGRRRGASTITMQTARNLFLWPSRSWLRKGGEAYFTILTEQIVPKRRIMELYLNNIEWGDGVFGAEAAAQANFGKSAKDLTDREAAQLASVLPNPRRFTITGRGPQVRQGTARALRGMRELSALERAAGPTDVGYTRCVLRTPRRPAGE
jgi:monofunctional biosynthetic peptidoglycan transglycosylase